MKDGNQDSQDDLKFSKKVLRKIRRVLKHPWTLKILIIALKIVRVITGVEVGDMNEEN